MKRSGEENEGLGTKRRRIVNSRLAEKATYKRGDKVLAKFKAGATSYPAYVTQAHKDDVYDLQYGEGDVEKGVYITLITSLVKEGKGYRFSAHLHPALRHSDQHSSISTCSSSPPSRTVDRILTCKASSILIIYVYSFP